MGPQGAVRRMTKLSLFTEPGSEGVRIKDSLRPAGTPCGDGKAPGLPSHPPLVTPGSGSSSRESQMP